MEKLNLDKELNKKLRDKINQYHNFLYEKEADFKFPSKRERVSSKAYNCICAALDRIDDLVAYCNTIEVCDVFKLCDLLNYGQTLIDCIMMIAHIYNVKYLRARDTSVFNKTGYDGKGNDEKYFKYLRSLCSVHPVETSYHSSYQGSEPEWCPYIMNNNLMVSIMLSEEESRADFIARVYRNDMEFDKYVPINVVQLNTYIWNRYNFIEEIIDAVEKYNLEKIKGFEKRTILAPQEFNTYEEYLENLQKEIIERCGKDNAYRVREWLAVMYSRFDDKSMQLQLEHYQYAMKQGIQKIHNGLQKMDIDHYFEVEPVEYNVLHTFNEYSYEMEKLNYLLPVHLIECESKPYIVITSDCGTCDKDRIDEMLAKIENAQKANVSYEELRDITRQIDSQYNVTNSEWARLMLKVIEPLFNNVLKFDYHLNDWYLYLQVQIAFWKLSVQRGE